MNTENLSSSFAKSRLVDELENFYQEYHTKEFYVSPKDAFFKYALFHPLFILWSFSIISLLLDFILLQSITSSSKWIYHESMLAESFYLLVFLIICLWLLWWESQNDNSEMLRKLHSIIESLKNSTWAPITEIPIPITRMLSLSRVIRDNQLQYLPFSLLVEGDTVQLSFGDVCPGQAKFISTGKNSKYDLILEANQILRPHSFHAFAKPESTLTPSQTFHFVLLSTPIVDSLKLMFSKKRPTSLLRNQADKILNKIYFIILPAILVISFVFNIAHFALSAERMFTWAAFLLVRQVYVILPLLPATMLPLWLIVRTLGNAKILLLYDQLEQSTTPFDDNLGVDEFDEEAPAPTKQVKFGQALLIARLFKGLLHKEEPPFNSSMLMEVLSSVTVICSVDRAGSIANPLPMLEQMLFFTEESPENGTLLDISYKENGQIYFEDKDWSTYLSNLKPVGLDILLNAHECQVYTNELHHKKYQTWSPVRLPVSLQSCQNAVAWAIGFPKEFSLTQYSTKCQFLVAAPFNDSILKNLREDSTILPAFSATISQEKASGNQLVVMEGIAQFVLNFCSDYWNGKSLVEIDQQWKRKVLEFCQNAMENDLECVAYAYSPIVSTELSLKEPRYSLFHQSSAPPKSKDDTLSKELLELFENQCFLALCTLGYFPKVDVREFIEDLRVAGIRFVYFSQKGQRESKAFGERLGLETDWNSLILLSSNNDPYAADSNGYLEPHDIKAKLPRGIENIRSHLKNVDDIPLHVSLFADCNPASVQEMMTIYHEYGEVVCCFGNTLNRLNAGIFALADVSIAIEPFQNMKTHKALSLGSKLISLPVDLIMNHQSSPYTLSQIIREARTFIINMTQGFAFLLGCQLALALTCLLSNIMLIPPVFVGFQILWMASILIPLLIIPFLFSSHPTTLDVMKLMPTKNKDHLPDFWRFFSYFLIRFVPIAALTIIVFIVTVQVNRPNTLWQFRDQFNYYKWLEMKNESQDVIIFAQCTASFTFIYSICLISHSFIHRTTSIIERPGFLSIPWVLSVSGVLILECLFLAGFYYFIGPEFTLAKLSWIFAIIFLVPLLFIPIQELAKSMDKRKFTRFQKRSKLEFNTKLGCYSPV